MLIVETIRKIRLSIHRDGKSIRKTAKELRVSRNTVRKAVRSEQTAFHLSTQLSAPACPGGICRGLGEGVGRGQEACQTATSNRHRAF